MTVCASLTSGTTIYQSDPCKDNTFAKTEAYIENFFDRIGRIDSAILNLSNEINSVVDLVGDTMNGFINSMLGGLADGLSELLSVAIKKLYDYIVLEDILPISKIVEEFAPLFAPVQELFDGLFCVATKIMKGAKDALSDIITGAAKNVLSGTACAAQEVVGAFTNNLINIVDSIVGPLINPISSFINSFGGIFFSFNIKDFLLTSVSAVRKISNLFECDDEKICPASSKFKIDQGPLKDMSEDEETTIFESVMSGVAISQGATEFANEFEESYGKWNIFGSPLSESSTLTPCDFGNVTKCGAPTVSFFGGDGFGAAGDVLLGNIIDNVDTEDALGDIIKVGSVIGVNITNPGQGYTDPPIVTFQDSCNHGYGAYGRAVIDQIPTSPTFGQITSVVITSEGENYPVESDEEVFYIVDVIVEDPGDDYDSDDTIEITDNIEVSDNFKLIITDGKVIDVEVLNDIKVIGYNGLPTLNIISLTGAGAILRPIMSVVPPSKELVSVIDCIS